MCELLEIEVVVQVLVNRLQFFQHIALSVGAIVLYSQPTAYNKQGDVIIYDNKSPTHACTYQLNGYVGDFQISLFLPQEGTACKI